MADKCGDCSCTDKSQCVKKGDSYGVVIVETKSFEDTMGMDGGPAGEHDGKCKCGKNCGCVNCTCGQ